MLTFFVTEEALHIGSQASFVFKQDAIIDFTDQFISVAIYKKEKVHIEVHLRNRYDFGQISGTLLYESDDVAQTIVTQGSSENQEYIQMACLALVKYAQVYELLDRDGSVDNLTTIDQEITGVLLDAFDGNLSAKYVTGIQRPELKKYVGPNACTVGRFYKTNSELDENGFIIIGTSFYGYFGKSVETLVIPEGVEFIQSKSFSNGNMAPVKEVIFPKSLKEVDEFVFGFPPYVGGNVYPERLERLVFLGDIEKIGKYAFQVRNEKRCIKEVVFEGKVKSIEEGAFSSAAIEVIEFHKGVEKIKQTAFRKCTSLKRLHITKAKRIWKMAFAGCTSLEEVSIPEKCKIDNNAFYCCTALAGEDGTISVNGVLSDRTPIEERLRDHLKTSEHSSAPTTGNGIINNDGDTQAKEEVECIRELLENKVSQVDALSPGELSILWSYKKLSDGTLCITRYNGEDLDVVIPKRIGNDVVSEIGPHAFDSEQSRCKNKNVRKTMNSVLVPDGIKRIGEFAFNGCEHMRTIILPKTLNCIEQSAFFCCSRMEKLELPEGLESIGNSAFGFCISLNDFTIPSSVKSIGNGILSSNHYVKDIYILSPEVEYVKDKLGANMGLEKSAFSFMSKELTLHGHKGSTTEALAQELGIRFEVL